jgi:hypothetical protein
MSFRRLEEFAKESHFRDMQPPSDYFALGASITPLGFSDACIALLYFYIPFYHPLASQTLWWSSAFTDSLLFLVARHLVALERDLAPRACWGGGG